MPRRVDRLSLFLYLGVMGSFMAAVAVGLFSLESKAVGILLLAAGLAAVVSARRLAIAQQQLAERRLVPIHWKEVRPLTFVLWGTGVVLFGLVQLLGL